MRNVVLPDSSVALVISSDQPAGVAAEARSIAAYLDSHPTVELIDVARMLLHTRELRRSRAIVRAHDTASAVAALAAVADGKPHPGAVVAGGPAKPRRAALVFPGQGSQRAGMGREFYETSASYRSRVDEINAEFESLVGISPRDYLLDADHAEAVTIVQPAIFLHTLGFARMWRDAGLAPVATIGHSQGEIAAVVESGQLSLRDGIRVVSGRAVQIEWVEKHSELTSCGMAVIAADREAIEAALARTTGWAELAVVNSATIHAISGYGRVVDEIVAGFRANGVFAQRIAVDHAGHTSELRRFAREFSGATAGVEATEFAPGEMLCIGATLGEPVTPQLPMSEYWAWNLRNVVRFDRAIETAVEHGIDTFVEMSEHPTMLLSVAETLAAQSANGVVVGTGKRKVGPMAEFTANLLTAVVADTAVRWGHRDPGPILTDFPHTRFAEATYWAPNVAESVMS